jgi:hypothetical protein
VLALAQTPEADRARAIDTQDADKQPSLSERQIMDALTAVSIRLGTKTFSEDAYRDELEKMRDEGINVDELRMPSEQQIARAMKRRLRQQADAFPLRARRREDPKKKSSTTVKAATKPLKRKPRPISPVSQWKARLKWRNSNKSSVLTYPQQVPPLPERSNAPSGLTWMLAWLTCAPTWNNSPQASAPPTPASDAGCKDKDKRHPPNTRSKGMAAGSASTGSLRSASTPALNVRARQTSRRTRRAPVKSTPKPYKRRVRRPSLLSRVRAPRSQDR